MWIGAASDWGRCDVIFTCNIINFMKNRACQRRIGPAPGSGFAAGIGRRLVEAKKREQVGKLLRRELFLDFLGHEREDARLHFVDLASRDRLDLAALDLQDDAFLAVFGQQSGQHAAVGGRDGRGLVTRADDQAGIEDVGEQLIEIIAPVRGDVGPDLLPYAVDLVALGAELAEDGLAGDGIAGRRANRVSSSARRFARVVGSGGRGSCRRLLSRGRRSRGPCSFAAGEAG